MTIANDIHAEGGTQFAVHTVADKSYPVGMMADERGNIDATLPMWGFMVPVSANAANKVFFDIFNADENVRLQMRKLFAIPALDVSATGSTGIRIDTYRTETQGAGGTLFGGDHTPQKATAAFWSFDPSQETLPPGITGRVAPTGGATEDAWLWPSFVRINESDPAGFDQQFLDLILNVPQPLILPAGYGLKIVQAPTAVGNGQLGFLGSFTVETIR